MRTSLVQTDAPPARPRPGRPRSSSERFGPGVDRAAGRAGRRARRGRAGGDGEPQARSLPDVAAVTPPRPSQDGTAALLTVIPSSAPDRQATVDLVHAIRDRFGGDGDPPGVRHRQDRGQHRRVAEARRRAADLPGARRRAVARAAGAGVPVDAGAGGRRRSASCSRSGRRSARRSRCSSGAGWRDVFGVDTTGPLMSFLPILLIGILFGLAMDYQVFLVSRMREAYVHGAAADDGDRHRLPARRPGGHRGRAHHDLGVRRLRVRRRDARSSRSASRWPSASCSTRSWSG